MKSEFVTEQENDIFEEKLPVLWADLALIEVLGWSLDKTFKDK